VQGEWAADGNLRTRQGVKRFVAVSLALGALFAAVPVGATAGEPEWWEVCEELPSSQIEKCFNEHNGETGEGSRPPTKPTAPLREHIERRYPSAHSVFLNCPANNTLGEGLACEFRFLLGRRVVKGVGSVQPEEEGRVRTAWWLVGFRAQAPAPRRWRRCSIHHHGSESSSPVRLSGYGTDCGEARELARRIAAFDVSQHNLRLPRHFTEGEFQTNTLGFVVARYRCSGRVQVRQGNPNPYGHETAQCRTRFGDKFIYVFDQGS
jgi:hypothetical protein